MKIYLIVEKTISRKVHPNQMHGAFLTKGEAESYCEQNGLEYEPFIVDVQMRGTLRELTERRKEYRLTKTACL